MPNINITVAEKIATNTTPGEVIVCNNSGYTVTFAFDSEWDAATNRVARFVYYKDGLSLYKDVEFTGTTAAVPVLNGVDFVLVGVYAGDLITTTPAKVLCDRSILCGDPEAIGPTAKEQLQEQIGVLGQLQTTNKSNLVLAVNEVAQGTADLWNSVAAIDNKLDKQPSSNLLNPKEFRVGWLAYQSGDYVHNAGNTNYGSTGYIPVSTKGLITKGSGTNGVVSYVVYDKQLNPLRSVDANDVYTYQQGDAYVVFCYYIANTSPEMLAVVEGSVYTFEAYSEYVPLDKVISDTEELKNRVTSLETKLQDTDLKLSESGGFLTNEPTVWRYVMSLHLTDGSRTLKRISLPVKSTVANTTIVVSLYNSTTLDNALASKQYTLDSTDEITVVLDSNYEFSADEPIVIEVKQISYEPKVLWYSANMQAANRDWIAFDGGGYDWDTENLSYENIKFRGELVFEYPISDNLADLAEDIENIRAAVGIHDKAPLALVDVSPVYSVLNDYNKNRNYASAVWLDHLIAGADWQDMDIGFGETKRKEHRFHPPLLADMAANTQETTFTPAVVSKDFEVENPSIIHRCSKASASAGRFPKVLVIGDSVTDGYLSGYNKVDPTSPSKYWSWTRYFFEKDKAEHGASGQDNCLMVGIPWVGDIWYGSHDTFSLDGQVYNSYAVGKGGWSAKDLNLPTFESDTNINPFYNATTGKFSLKTALDKYKTIADDGTTRLVVGSTAGTEVMDAQAYDFCTPTHVVINLNHNSSVEEYKANIPEIVNTIKTEYPNMVVILMMIDETGTYFPAEYPDYDPDVIGFTYLHTKDMEIYKYIRETLENEANGVYVCSGHLVQHPVASYPSIDFLLPEFEGDTSKAYHSKSDAGGPNWHPNNRAHSAWGYQLYALIKWTLAID